MGRRGSGQCGGHAVGVGDVAHAGHGAAVSVLRADVRRHLGRQVCVHVKHRHLGAQAGQFARSGLAQTRCATGDDGGLSLNVHVNTSQYLIADLACQ